MLAAQTHLELTLLLRNGEQLLLTVFIPITMLIELVLLPIGDLGESRVNTVLPGVMMAAIMSTAFTGQAIAVGFDRRYGALKRLGATPLPKWGIIAGKSSAVVIVVALQSVLLGAIGLTLGWRPSLTELVLGAVMITLGTVMFAALGLLLDGTMRAESFSCSPISSGSSCSQSATSRSPGTICRPQYTPIRIVPSGVLAHALDSALASTVDWPSVLVLIAWAGGSSIDATRWFKFT